jgi:electron transport complex protein RnfC
MTQRSFFGFGKPRLEYSQLPARVGAPVFVPPNGSVTLLHRRPDAADIPPALKAGDAVKSGQKISLYAGAPDYVTSPVAGRISGLSAFDGDYGRRYTAVTIAVAAGEAPDEPSALVPAEPSLEAALSILGAAPGLPALERLAVPDRPLKTLVVCGLDQDIGVLTQQYVLQARQREVVGGIRVLKQIAGFEEVVILTLKEAIQGYGHIGARVVGVDPSYPSAHPQMVMHQVFGQTVPAGRACEDLGYGFISAEAVAAVGTAFASRRIPHTKLLTLIPKDGFSRLVETPIGTPIGVILEKFGVSVAAGDRVVCGGPMRGAAVYGLDHPVQPDTDAVMVLDQSRAARVSDYACINCGECVRACPARIQVNLLVCYLEAGKYADAEESYDLHSCIECGLCSYVCVSKIPILQYITLAKHELARMRLMEATHA